MYILFLLLYLQYVVSDGCKAMFRKFTALLIYRCSKLILLLAVLLQIIYNVKHGKCHASYAKKHQTSGKEAETLFLGVSTGGAVWSLECKEVK